MDSFRVRRPPGTERVPIVFDSPHSGRFYPDDFDTKASREELRRGEDAYVDELLDSAPALGVTVLDAMYPRCYIDLNRAETDIDQALLSEPWPTPLAPTDKSARGLGLLRRHVVPGVEVHARLLTAGEVRARIERVYRPYHVALDALLREALAEHGRVWHIDWHSMKSAGNAMTPDGPVPRSFDFVVSDLEGRSASPSVTAVVVRALRDLGYRVVVNDPYKGGEIISRTGAPHRGVHSVQVEINRALYLDEALTAKNSGFESLRENLNAFTRTLISALNA